MTENETISLLHERVQKTIEQYGIDCSAIKCDPTLADTAAFCEHYKFSPDETSNCIIVVGKTDPVTYCCCLILANSKLDVNKTVSGLLGIKRCSFASAEQTAALTGMEIGGVTPIGIPEDVPLYVDAAIMKCQRIVLGGGNRSSKIVIDPVQLRKIPRVTVVDDLGLPR